MEVRNMKGRMVDFEEAVAHMDDELREELMRQDFSDEQAMFHAYERAHAEKYGEAWSWTGARGGGLWNGNGIDFWGVAPEQGSTWQGRLQ